MCDARLLASHPNEVLPQPFHARFITKQEQVARLVPFAVRGDRDLLPCGELLIAVARQTNAARRVYRLRESRAIDPPFGAPAPEVGRACKPLERELRQGEMPRLRTDFLLAAHEAGRDGAFLSVRKLDHSAP